MQIDQSLNDFTQSQIAEQAIQMVKSALQARYQVDNAQLDYIAQELFGEYTEQLGSMLLENSPNLQNISTIGIAEAEQSVAHYGAENIAQMFQHFLQQIAQGEKEERIKELLEKVQSHSI